MKKIFSNIWAKVLAWFLGIILSTGSIGYVSVLVIQDTPIYKKIDRAFTIAKWLETEHAKDTVDIFNAKEHIDEEVVKKKKEYQVGLRYNKANKKLYWRDKSKEYREIKSDYTGDYYRDEHDNKVYINDKL